MAHTDYFRINIDIMATNRLTARVLDVSNAFNSTNVPIHERVCVSTPPYYMNWFEKSHPNFTLYRDASPFCLQCMNVIQGTKPAEKNRIDSLMNRLKP